MLYREIETLVVAKTSTNIHMDNKSRDRFLALLDKEDGPNDALLQAAEEFNKGRVEDDIYHFSLADGRRHQEVRGELTL